MRPQRAAIAFAGIVLLLATSCTGGHSARATAFDNAEREMAACEARGGKPAYFYGGVSDAYTVVCFAPEVMR